MATYEYRTWETINLPAVSGDTHFIIYDHQTTNPGDDLTGIIYSGLVLDGYRIQNLNEILSQYVNPTQIVFSSSVQPDNASNSKFYIYYTQDDWSSYTSDTIILTYDWSYIQNYNRSVLSDPIINLVDNRQFFVYTIKAGSPDVVNTITMKIGNITVVSLQISGYTYYNVVQDLSTSTYPGEFTYAYSYDFFVDRSVPIDGVNEITIGPSKYYVTNTCYRYCLYYINQYGGWDSLLFRGRELKTDALSRLSYKKNYVAQSTDFNKVDYLTTIGEHWSLNTSFLDDTESSKMINLMASNKIFIHDLETGHISPVNITNSSCEHKTYKNQGRKMATYEIEVAASQPKYRV
jgi:hypothetical protein